MPSRKFLNLEALKCHFRCSNTTISGNISCSFFSFSGRIRVTYSAFCFLRIFVFFGILLIPIAYCSGLLSKIGIIPTKSGWLDSLHFPSLHWTFHTTHFIRDFRQTASYWFGYPIRVYGKDIFICLNLQCNYVARPVLEECCSYYRITCIPKRIVLNCLIGDTTLTAPKRWWLYSLPPYLANLTANMHEESIHLGEVGPCYCVW